MKALRAVPARKLLEGASAPQEVAVLSPALRSLASLDRFAMEGLS